MYPRRLKRAIALLAALLIAGAAAQLTHAPGPRNIILPHDWESAFVRYATVDKADRRIIRHLYVNPEALEAARPRAPLPYGTLIIMADTRALLADDGTPLRDKAGRFVPEPGWIAIAAQQKAPGWGAGYGPQKRNGEWEYARFNPDGSRNAGSVEACFACHLHMRAAQDFAFDLWDTVQARP